jgi:hypothetical protein
VNQHWPSRLEAIVGCHPFSLGVVRGLLEKHVESLYAQFDGRCEPKDVHGGFVSGSMRQNLWADLQLHAQDPRGATLRAPGRRGTKLDFLVLTGGGGVTMRLRKHPRLPHSTELEPVVVTQGSPTLDSDLFGVPARVLLYVLFDVDLQTQALAGVWLGAVSDFDVDSRRVIHGRVPLPPAPAVLLPGNIQPLAPVDPDGMGFDGLLPAEEESGEDPA